MPDYRPVMEELRDRARKRRESRRRPDSSPTPTGQEYWDARIAEYRCSANKRVHRETEHTRRHATKNVFRRLTVAALISLMVLAAVAIPLLMQGSDSEAYFIGVRLVWVGATCFVGACFVAWMTAGFDDELIM